MRSANRRGARLAGTVAGFAGAALLIGVAAADEGYASWYGPGFQGNRMANGQPSSLLATTFSSSHLSDALAQA